MNPASPPRNQKLELTRQDFFHGGGAAPADPWPMCLCVFTRAWTLSFERAKQDTVEWNPQDSFFILSQRLTKLPGWPWSYFMVQAGLQQRSFCFSLLSSRDYRPPLQTWLFRFSNKGKTCYIKLLYSSLFCTHVITVLHSELKNPSLTGLDGFVLKCPPFGFWLVS